MQFCTCGVQDSRKQQAHNWHQQQSRVHSSSCLWITLALSNPFSNKLKSTIKKGIASKHFIFGLKFNFTKKCQCTLLNTCSLFIITSPPLKKAQPSTSNMLDKTEPSCDCWTTRIMPFLNAKIDMINSITFPKVAFKSPPTVKLNSLVSLKEIQVYMWQLLLLRLVLGFRYFYLSP